MGKLLDTLRSAVPGPRMGNVAPQATEPASEEVSFIEIGPKRQIIAASADVLASGQKPAAPPASAPSVQFRSVTPLPGSLRAVRRPQFAADLVCYHTPHSPEAARYLELYLSIRDATATKAVVDHFVLLLSGLWPGVGATTVLLNVAISAAQQGRRTLVIDANLRRPAIADRVGLAHAPGLAEVLAADCSQEAAIRPTGLEGLSVLTAGEPQPILADVRTITDLLAGVREQFDMVFVDGPAWDGRTTVTALAGASDAVFLVVPLAEADGPEASALVSQLPLQGVRLAGTILTGH